MRSSCIGRRRPTETRRLSTLILVAGGLLGLAAVAAACQTPVYRFAMYNWERTPYMVYYLHEGEIAPSDAKVNEAIRELAEGTPAANLEIFTIDVSSQEPLKEIPRPLHGEASLAIENHKGAKSPRYAIYSPLSSEVFSGSIKAEDVPLLADSPVRKTTNAMLAAGNVAVMILVLSDDAEANARAEKECQKVIEAAREGLIATDGADLSDLVELGPKAEEETEEKAQETDEEAQDEETTRMDVGLVKLSRDDLKERWLLRCLLQVEEELTEQTEPMVFTIYGRGRANLPHIGRGIDEDLLTNQIRFVMGPCSCQVKRGNPGMDLMTLADWNSTAIALAERYGTETGNEHLLGEAEFPDIFGEQLETSDDDQPDDEPASKPTPDTTAETVEAEPAMSAETRSTDDRSTAPLVEPDVGDAKKTSNLTTASRPNESSRSERDAESESGMQNLGYGIVAAVVLMALATLLVFMRPRG